MFASRASFNLLSLVLAIIFASVCAMKESTSVSLSSRTRKHETVDTFGFDAKSSSMTFQKLKMKIFSKSEEEETTTTQLPNVYLSLCPLSDNLNLEKEASGNYGAWCEASVGKLNETNTCLFAAFAGAEEASETIEGEQRRRSRRRSLLDDDDGHEDSNVIFEKEYAPMQINVNEKKVYDIAFFTCDLKGTTIEIDVKYETLNDGKHHLSTAWQPILSVYLYILLCYVIFIMLQMTHTMSMCAIYRNESVISMLHYAMWTTQVIRMVHLGLSFNHFNYIDMNGMVNDSFHHGVIICSSLKEMTFWTVLLAVSGGWRVTLNRVSRKRKLIFTATMFMLFLCNVVGQMELGLRTVYFVYALTYCCVISMILFWSSKTLQTLREQVEIFRRSGANEEEIARAPVKAKDQMYRKFYVAFMLFCGLKVMNHILSTYFERKSAWAQFFFSEFFDMMLWCFLLVLFRPRDQRYTTSFPANGFDPFGIDASVRAAEMGIQPREGLMYLPDIYVAEVSAASKIEREFLRNISNSDVAVTAVPMDQSDVSDSGAASRTSPSVDSIELFARGVMPSSPRFAAAATEQSSTTTLSSLASTTGSGDVEQGFVSIASSRARLSVFVVENPPTKRDGSSLSESIALAIKTDDIEAHRERERREREAAAAAVAEEQEQEQARE